MHKLKTTNKLLLQVEKNNLQKAGCDYLRKHVGGVIGTCRCSITIVEQHHQNDLDHATIIKSVGLPKVKYYDIIIC